MASYNVLADAYIVPRFYPRTPAALLDPLTRRPALIRRVSGLGADVICLQEVDGPVLEALRAELEPQGCAVRFVQKHRKPDGCALIARVGIVLQHVENVRFADDTGHVALAVVIEHEGRLLGVATTHLKWDPPGTARDEQRGYRQVTELLEVLRGSPCASWIVCGDFNAVEGSEVARAMASAGFRDLYAGRPDAWTCNSNGRATRIDFLFHTPDLDGRAGDVPPIDDETPLPGPGEPSDHLPIVGWFEPPASKASA